MFWLRNTKIMFLVRTHIYRPVHLWAFGSGELKETVRHVYLSPVFISMKVTEITKEPVSTSAFSLV